MGSDTLGKCGTWTCGLFAGLDMEDTEDTREKETLKLIIAEVRQIKCHCREGFGYL